jgi:hypothetical protein
MQDGAMRGALPDEHLGDKLFRRLCILKRLGTVWVRWEKLPLSKTSD